MTEAPLRRGFLFWAFFLLGERSRETPVAYATIGRRFNNCLTALLE